MTDTFTLLSTSSFRLRDTRIHRFPHTRWRGTAASVKVRQRADGALWRGAEGPFGDRKARGDRLRAEKTLVDNSPAESQQVSPVGGRLDSWKEIASYLRKSVRSVQRWEAEEGMPVHRHVHAKAGTVYAFASELDAWWKERGAILAEQNGAVEAELSPVEPVPAPAEATIEVSPSHPRPSRRAVWVAIGFTAAVLAVGTIAWLSRNGAGLDAGSRPALPFHARDWVLVASFENRTGEPLFDGTLDYALGRELSNSRHVAVVSRDRVSHALRLMRKPLDARLDAPLAREVCLRDGEIRALLAGRVERLGSKYLFSVELIDPKLGTSLAGFREESGGTDGSLAAMRRISDRVRAALGETRAPEAREEAPLAKVTTSNLLALQLYSRAQALMAASLDSQPGAEELLRQAVAEDPNFASAYILLAYAINNQDRPPEDYLPYVETAFRLSETTTERERYFIRGSYYYFMGDRAKAIAAYEALVSFHPDHGWAVTNLTALYELPQDLDKAVQVEARAADSMPKSFEDNWNAGYNYVVWKREPARARPYLRRAADLATPEVTDGHAWAVAWMELVPFTELWLKGDVAAAAGELDRFAAKLDSLGRSVRDNFALKAVLAYLTLGRIEAASRAAEKIFDPTIRNDALAQISFFEGDTRALHDQLRFPGDRAIFPSPGWWETIAILQARGGLTREARRYVTAEDQRATSGWQGRLQAVRGRKDRLEFHNVPGEIALQQGNLADAIAALEKATSLAPEWQPQRPSFFLGSESLAGALEKKEGTARALQVLELASGRKFQAIINNNSGAYWLRSRLALARLYRKTGRLEDARAVEADLSNLLALADADHPMRLELEGLRGS
jgi:tetratricopeptide (TPR) repeat protein